MTLKKFITALALVSVITQGAFAEDVTIIGSIKHTLKQADNDSTSEHKTLSSTNPEKVIQLLQVELSNDEKQLLATRSQNALTHTQQFSFQASITNNSLTPEKVQLGMNNVPVLDQGIHGTCVTFAITGAIDAVIGKGDYISQLCNLQLGTYLENHGSGLSGWDGSYPIYVINQIEQYGVINKDTQRTFGCGGLTQYPTYSAHNASSFMEPEVYSSKSELIFGKSVNWSEAYDRSNPEQTLNDVKQALSEGDRLVFATLLPRTDLGFVGAVGRHNTWFYKDSWVLTPAIIAGIDNVESAHEMIITGYDDNATATDDNGKKHKGLLTLRNSWGASVGDYGEFYMSYDYFKLLAYDVKRISRPSI